MIRSLQGIRVIGMMSIFLFHIGFLKDTSYSNIYNILFYDGYYAVTLFFILSGLFTYYKLCKQRTHSSKEINKYKVIKFLKKIWIIHIITFIFSVILNIVSYKENILKNLIIGILNIFLLQAYIPIKDVYFSFNGVS